ncbi:hypothetical protein [Nonomuraea sp. NPDC049400]|uniref:Kae1-like domain-containing protein n=1 Tax=Nonomuraea sp. NPDC049400 TaxID=3364352 RepID=UPI0037908CCE
MSTLRHLLEAKADGEPVGRIATAFHATIAAVTVLLCARAAAEHDVTQVRLSGGFQNRLLATDALASAVGGRIRAVHQRAVQLNDGGRSDDRAVVAAARLASP